GIDKASSSATVKIKKGANCDGDEITAILSGPTEVKRGAGDDTITPHTIVTEMVSLELTNGTITLRAGDGVGNLDDDGPLHSPGAIEEQASDPAKAKSFFMISFEIDTPFGTLHNKDPLIMESVIEWVPPKSIFTYTHSLPEAVPLYDTSDTSPEPVAVACLVNAKHRLSVELDSFTATAANGEVALKWATGIEKDNAGFVVWRGQSVNGQCSNDPSNYTDVQAITPLVASQGTEVSGATYTMTDSNVVSGKNYCYALEDIDYNSKSTFHMNDIVSATP
ncbi:hypothetical protein QUF54_08090, partial [Candidatus Marithioploca araucensis]|nr:hypothetical protein [Candidatus Marithioploca araucensis]